MQGIVLTMEYPAMNTHPACPCCTDGLRECSHCYGAGTLEVSEDRLDSRGEHRTRDWTVTCSDCRGTGAEPCSVCGATGIHPLVGALLAVGREMHARRVLATRLAGYAPVNDAQRAAG